MTTLLLVLSLLCFLLDTFNVSLRGIKLLPLGLAFFVASYLL